MLCLASIVLATTLLISNIKIYINVFIMAFDFTQYIKENYFWLLAMGVFDLAYMLMFPKGSLIPSIMPPKVMAPLGWGVTIAVLGLGAYGMFLNSQSHYARSNYVSSINPYYRGEIDG